MLTSKSRGTPSIRTVRSRSQATASSASTITLEARESTGRLSHAPGQEYPGASDAPSRALVRRVPRPALPCLAGALAGDDGRARDRRREPAVPDLAVRDRLLRARGRRRGRGARRL